MNAAIPGRANNYLYPYAPVDGRADHGTKAGYQAHRKRGEKACKPCRDANAAHRRTLRRSKAADLYTDELTHIPPAPPDWRALEQRDAMLTCADRATSKRDLRHLLDVLGLLGST